MDWFKMLADWPTVSLLLVGLFATYHGVRLLSLTFGWGMGALGTYWRTRRQISDTKVLDLEKRITYLDDQVAALRYRDEAYFAYVLTIDDWQRKQVLTAKAQGWTLDPPISFMEFRDRWMIARGLDKDLGIWK